MNRTVRSGAVELETQAFGDPASPPVLLVMGAMASMLWWPEEFCESLAARGRYVIRYDNRDTGLSTAFGAGRGDYAIEDMADDAIAVLDAYGIARAHVVGMSLGGTIAQIAAFRHPARFASLALISTSPVGLPDVDLPGMSEAYLAHGATVGDVDWSDPAQAIDFVVKETRVIAGTSHPYDEARSRALVEADVARASDFHSATNHFMVTARQDWTGRLRELTLPVLILHGSADPIYPLEHGRAIAAAIPGASLVVLEGGGHELHPAHWPLMIDELVALGA